MDVMFLIMGGNSTLKWNSISDTSVVPKTRQCIFNALSWLFHAALPGGRVAERMAEGLISALELTQFQWLSCSLPDYEPDLHLQRTALYTWRQVYLAYNVRRLGTQTVLVDAGEC